MSGVTLGSKHVQYMVDDSNDLHGMKRLDLRDLPAPFLRALEAADALEPGGELEVLTPLLPIPLLEQLEASGFHWCKRPWDQRGVRVAILRPMT